MEVGSMKKKWMNEWMNEDCIYIRNITVKYTRMKIKRAGTDQNKHRINKKFLQHMHAKVWKF